MPHAVRGHLFERDETLGMRDRQLAQQERVDEAEYGRGRADTQGERQDSDEREGA